jgi:hypothetical protein
MDVNSSLIEVGLPAAGNSRRTDVKGHFLTDQQWIIPCYSL